MATFTTTPICNLDAIADQWVCEAVLDRCRVQNLDLLHTEVQLDATRFLIEDNLMFLNRGEEDYLDCYDLHVERHGNHVEVWASYTNTIGPDFTRIWHVLEDQLEEFDHKEQCAPVVLADLQRIAERYQLPTDEQPMPF